MPESVGRRLADGKLAEAPVWCGCCNYLRRERRSVYGTRGMFSLAERPDHCVVQILRIVSSDFVTMCITERSHIKDPNNHSLVAEICDIDLLVHSVPVSE